MRQGYQKELQNFSVSSPFLNKANHVKRKWETPREVRITVHYSLEAAKNKKAKISAQKIKVNSKSLFYNIMCYDLNKEHEPFSLIFRLHTNLCIFH